jgi:hypothetical protein
MDEGKNGVDEAVAEQLEQRAGAIRDSLTGLVDELDHRRQGVAWRVAKPLIVVAGLAIAIVAGRIWWRARGVRGLRRAVGLR